MEGRDKNGSTSTIKKLVGRLRGSSVSSQGSGSRSRRASPSPVSQGILETWNAAYDSLADDPSCAGLVVAYETIISNELPDRLKMGGLNSSFRGKTADERLELLTAIASAGLERRRGSDTSQADDLAKKILDQARHYAQATMAQHAAAAIAWTGFCTLTPVRFQFLMSPFFFFLPLLPASVIINHVSILLLSFFFLVLLCSTLHLLTLHGGLGFPRLDTSCSWMPLCSDTASAAASCTLSAACRGTRTCRRSWPDRRGRRRRSSARGTARRGTASSSCSAGCWSWR